MVLFRGFKRYRLRGLMRVSVLAIIIILAKTNLNCLQGQRLLKFQEMKGPIVLKASQRCQSWSLFTQDNIRQMGDIFPRNSKPTITSTLPYLIPNRKVCSGIRGLTYVIVIHSAPGNVDRRLSLRRTWANQTLFTQKVGPYSFLGGLQTTISRETFARKTESLVTSSKAHSRTSTKT